VQHKARHKIERDHKEELILLKIIVLLFCISR
jgi:hypothetical protein